MNPSDRFKTPRSRACGWHDVDRIGRPRHASSLEVTLRTRTTSVTFMSLQAALSRREANFVQKKADRLRSHVLKANRID